MHAQIETQEKNKEEKMKKTALEHYRNRDFRKAIPLYKEIIKNNNSTTYYTYLLNSYIGIADYKEAKRLVKSQIKKHPNQPRYKVDRAYLKIQNGKEEKGYKEYNKLIDNVKPDKESVTSLASAFSLRGEIPYAIKTYQHAREINKNDNLFSFYLGALYGRNGNLDLMYDEFLITLLTDKQKISVIKSRLNYYFRQDKNDKQKETFKAKLIRMLQKHPDIKVFSDLMLWFALQTEDFDTALKQALAIDKRYNENGKTLYEIAGIFLENREYELTEKALTAIIDKGEENNLYHIANQDLIKTRFLHLTNSNENEKEAFIDLENDIKEMLTTLDFTPTSFELRRYLAQIQAYHLNKTDAAIATLKKAITIRGLRQINISNAKMDLGDIYMISNDPWEAILMYAQVHTIHKNDPLGHEAKLRHAKVSYYIGEFSWAETQLKVLKGATSKLIANDALELSVLINNNLSEDSLNIPLKLYAKADLEILKKNYAIAETLLDSLNTLKENHKLHDYALYKKAEIALATNSYEKADSLLKLCHEQYSDQLLADNAIFLRIKIQHEFLKNKTKTLELCTHFLEAYKGSIYTEECRLLFRKLNDETKPSDIKGF